MALAVVAALLWRGSDAAATESTTAAPADVPPGTPAGAVSPAWSADGGPLPADVVEAGRVVVGSEHGVRALDVVSGEEAWHYTRSNARLCGLTVTDGLAVAVFRTASRCDEAVALDAGTGVRAWTRSLGLRGDAVLTSTARIVLASSPTGVLTFDPVGNNVRWRAGAPEGCRWLDAAAGSAGVAVLQRCEDADEVQLRLYDGFEGTEHWTIDVPLDGADEALLLGAGELIGVRVGGEARLFAPGDGAFRTALAGDTGESAGLASAAGLALVHVGDTVWAIDPGTGEPRWSAPANGAPAVTQDAVVVPTGEGFVLHDAVTGAELSRWATPSVPADGVATVIGPVVVLRLDDEVRGYR